jgi:hypothetical protein
VPIEVEENGEESAAGHDELEKCVRAERTEGSSQGVHKVQEIHVSLQVVCGPGAAASTTQRTRVGGFDIWWAGATSAAR